MSERRNSGFLGAIVRASAQAGFMLNETHYAARSSLPRHCHEQAYLCLILAGTYQEDYGRNRRSCGPRMLAFHPAEEVHAERFDQTEARSFNIELSPSCRSKPSDASIPRAGGPHAGGVQEDVGFFGISF